MLNNVFLPPQHFIYNGIVRAHESFVSKGIYILSTRRMSPSSQIDALIKGMEAKSGFSQEDLPLLTSIKHFPPTPKTSLTFGVEFEMVITAIPQGSKDLNPQDKRKGFTSFDSSHGLAPEELLPVFYADIQGTLRDNGIPSEVDIADGDTKPPWRPKDPRSWIIKNDTSILPPERVDEFGAEWMLERFHTGYSWVPVEIITPVLYFSEVALEGVQQVVNVLSSNYRVNVNPSAGLHRHVGNSKEGFSLQTLQNFYATMWTFDPQFETIIPSNHLKNEQNYSLRRDTNLSDVVHAKDLHLLPRLGLEILLDKPVSLEHLGRIVRHSGNKKSGVQRISYCVGGLLLYWSKGERDGWKPTIEFRVHTATLDPTAVKNWTKLCVGLLEFADTVDPLILRAFLERRIDESTDIFPIEKNCMDWECQILPSTMVSFRKICRKRRVNSDLLGNGT